MPRECKAENLPEIF